MDKFVKWSGGSSPVAGGTKVEVKINSGNFNFVAEASELRWEWEDGGRGGDIVCYRVLASEQSLKESYKDYYDVIDDALVIRHLGVASGDARKDLERIIDFDVAVALDPAVSEPAQALIDKGRAEASSGEGGQDVSQAVKEMRVMFGIDEATALAFLMPHWAVDTNMNHEVVLGAQLATKDGRRMGNAHVIDTSTTIYGDYFVILTDAGNRVTMTESEILSSFWVGDWISDVKEVVRKFGSRQGE